MDHDSYKQQEDYQIPLPNSLSSSNKGQNKKGLQNKFKNHIDAAQQQQPYLPSVDSDNNNNDSNSNSREIKNHLQGYSLSADDTDVKKYHNNSQTSNNTNMDETIYENEGQGGEGDDRSEVEAELEPLDILLQFIPYYGQGDYYHFCHYY